MEKTTLNFGCQQGGRPLYRHLFPAGDGQGVFTLEIGIPDMSLCIDTGETQGLLLDVGDRVSLVIRGLRFFPYEL